MYECDTWTIKEVERQGMSIVVLELTLESPLDCEECKLVNPKGNQPWIFTGSTEANAPILLPPDAKSRVIRKDPDAGKDTLRKRGGWWRTRCLDSITDTMDMNLSNFWEIVDRGAWHASVYRITKHQDRI